MSERKIVPENDGKLRECTFDSSGALSMCWPLEAAVEHPYGRGTRRQGLKFLTFTNIKTHKFSRNAISCISGEMQGQGSQLNFCPFCAQPLQFLIGLTVTVDFEDEDGAEDE